MKRYLILFSSPQSKQVFVQSIMRRNNIFEVLHGDQEPNEVLLYCRSDDAGLAPWARGCNGKVLVDVDESI